MIWKYFNEKKFIRFLFEILQKQEDSEKKLFNSYLFETKNLLITKTVFENFNWFIVINIALKNFKLATFALEYQLQEIDEKTMEVHQEFSTNLSCIISDLDPILRNEQYNNEPDLIYFLCLSLTIIKQDQVYKRLCKFLKSKCLLVRIKNNKSIEKKQRVLFEVYLAFFKHKQGLLPNLMVERNKSTIFWI